MDTCSPLPWPALYVRMVFSGGFVYTLCFMSNNNEWRSASRSAAEEESTSIRHLTDVSQLERSSRGAHTIRLNIRQGPYLFS